MKHLLVILTLLLPVLARGQGAGSVAVVPTLADLATRVPSQLNPVVQVQGYRAIGDWGAGRPIRYNATSTNAVDNGCVFATVTGVGRWEAPDCDGGRINVRYFGAYGNGTSNDLNYLRAAAAKLVDGSTLYSPPGYTYRITDPVYVTNDRVRVEFSGSVLKLVSEDRVPALRVGPSADVAVSGMNFALDPTTNRVTGVPINTFAAGDMLLLYNLIQNPADYYPGQMAFVVSASGTEMVLDRFPDTALQVTNATRFVAPPDGVEVRNLGVDLSEAGDGIGISAIGRGHVIENCRVTGTGTTNDPNYIGIELRGQSITARGNYVNGILDADNTFDRSGYGIFAAGDGIVVENNDISDCKHNISTSERRAVSPRLQILSNRLRLRKDWAALLAHPGAYLFLGSLDVHANVRTVEIRGNDIQASRLGLSLRNGDFDVINNRVEIVEQAGLPYIQIGNGFGEAFITRAVFSGNTFIAPTNASQFYWDHSDYGVAGVHRRMIWQGNTFIGAGLTVNDQEGALVNPFEDITFTGNIFERTNGTPLAIVGTASNVVISGNVFRYGGTGNGITLAIPTNPPLGREIFISGNTFVRQEGGTGFDIDATIATNVVALAINRWSPSTFSYVGPVHGIAPAVAVTMHDQRDTYPRVIGTYDGKLKFGTGEVQPYSSISLLYPGAIQTDGIWTVKVTDLSAPAFGTYFNAFSNYWNFVIRGDGMMAYRYSNEVDSVVATPIVVGPRRFEDLTNGVWRLSGNLGITSNAVPIVPETSTATLWLANAAANVRDLRIVWPDGIGGKVTGKLWHEYNDGTNSGLDADLLDGQHGAYYLSRTNISVLNFSDLHTREANAGEVVFVRSGSEIRKFYGTNSIPATGTNRANASDSSVPSKWWVSEDINVRPQKAVWWGLIGDGITDNSAAFADMLSFTRDIEIQRGRYAFASTIAITNAESISIVSPDGSYQGGYHSTNLVTETEFVYTGPPTSIFFDFEPAPPGALRYGNKVENITFNANGLADTSVRIGHMGRARFVGCRFLGATGVNWLVNASQFCTFIDCSTSINDETPTPTVRATYGMSLTNFSPANVFIDCQWENSSGTAVLLAGNARNNSFFGGAIEANDGDGLVLESGATANTFIGTWFESNGGTNSLWIKSGAIQNSFTGLRMFEDLGAIRVAGSYNTFQNFGARSIWIEPDGTRNKWENMIWVDWLVDETAGGNSFRDMVNSTATVRTNTLSSPFVQYGEPFSLWSFTNLYARTELRLGQLSFGTGSNPLDWTLQRFSAGIGGTTNEFRVVAPYSSFPAVSLYNAETWITTNEVVTDLGGGLYETNSVLVTNGLPFTSATWSPEEIAFGPGTTVRDTSWKRRGVSNWVTTAEVWLQRLTNEVVLATLTPETTVAVPFAVRGDGTHEWGPGTAIRSTSIRYDSEGTLRVSTNLVVDGGITLGGVKRTSWPTDLGDAISNGAPHGRQDGAWVEVAPTNHGHVAASITGLGPLALTDAPTNGLLYGRQDGAWAEAAEAFHTHDADDVVTGEFDPARLGTGTADTDTFLSGGGGGSQSWRQVLTNDVGGLSDWMATKSDTGHAHAASDVTSGTFMAERLGTGTATTNTFLQGNGTNAPFWGTIPSTPSPTNGITDAPADGVFYGRKNNSWTQPDIADLSGISSFGLPWIDGTVVDDVDALDYLNLVGSGVATIDSPATYSVRVNSGGSASTRHRLNLIASGGLSLSISDDGVNDESDVTVTLPDASISYAKVANVVAGKLLGRGAGSGDGAMEAITVGGGLTMTGTTLHTNPVTVAASKLVGRGSAAGSGASQEITLGTGLSMSGTTLNVAVGNSTVLGNTDAVTVPDTELSETTLIGTIRSGESATFGAGTLPTGSIIKVEAMGTVSASGNWANGVLRVKFGSSRALAFTLLEEDSHLASDYVWRLTAWLSVTTAGASATTVLSGMLEYEYPSDADTPGVRRLRHLTGTASGTLDTTASNAFDLTWDNAAGLEVDWTCNHLLVTRY